MYSRWCNEILILWLICRLVPSGAAATTPSKNFGQQELRNLLVRIETWPDGLPRYGESAWRKLIAGAKAIQQCDPVAVQRALKEFQSRPATNSPEELDDDKKLFLLMRVIFELPEREPSPTNEWRTVFAGYVTMLGEYNGDGTINVAWPLSWRKGKPLLLSGCIGIQGVNARYCVWKEYEYFRSKYPMRDLHKHRSK